MNSKLLERGKTGVKPDRLITREEFRELVGIGRTTEWKLGIEGKLPTAVIVRGRKRGYLESSYFNWLRENSK